MHSLALWFPKLVCSLLLVFHLFAIAQGEVIRDKRLLQKASLEAENIPLKEVAEELSRKHKLPLRIDKTVDETRDGEVTITLKVNGVTLQSLLTLICESTGSRLAWTVDKTGVTLINREAEEQRQQAIDYSLTAFAVLFSEPEELQELLEFCTSGPWEEIDGIGGKILAQTPQSVRVQQSERIHLEIAEIFGALEGIVSGRKVPPSPIESTNGRLRAALARPTAAPKGEFTIQTALEELLGGSKVPFILSPNLHDEGIDLTQAASFEPGRKPLQALLAEILNPLKLEVLVENEVVKVTTRSALEEHFSTQVYDVRKLLSGTTSIEDIAGRIRQAEGTGPWEDSDGLGGVILPLKQVLVIRHHPAAHGRIGELLGGR